MAQSHPNSSFFVWRSNGKGIFKLCAKQCGGVKILFPGSVEEGAGKNYLCLFFWSGCSYRRNASLVLGNTSVGKVFFWLQYGMWGRFSSDFNMVVSHSLSPTANVHCICEEFKVYLPQCAAHDQLHAENADGDVCPGHTHLLPACLHLYPPACHSPAQCNDHKEEGECLPVWEE